MGKHQVGRETVRGITTPEPTATFVPIPHSAETIDGAPPTGLIEQVEEALLEAGFSIESEDHVLARDGQRYFGGFALTREDMDNSSRQLVCGIRNSHDMSFGSAICIGNKMTVCDNLDFFAQHVIGRRHTKNIKRDLPFVISKIISGLVSAWTEMGDRIEAYKRVFLTHEDASLLFNKLVEQGALPASKSYKAYQLWRNPSLAATSIVNRDSFIVDEVYQPELYAQAITTKENDLKISFGCGVSLWGAYNAVTQLLKNGNMQELPNRTMKMQALFDTMANIKHSSSVGLLVDGNEPEYVEEETFRETFQPSIVDVESEVF